MAEEDQPIVGKGAEVRQQWNGIELDPNFPILKAFSESDSIALSFHSVGGVTPATVVVA